MTAVLPAASPAARSAHWRRPDARTLLVQCGWLAAPLGSAALTALATGGRMGQGAWITLGAITAAFIVVAAFGAARWSRTRYRLTDDSLVLRSGVFHQRLRTVPLERIRSVDLTATPAHRLLGLTVVRAGTSASGGGQGEIALNAVSRSEGQRLRSALVAKADRHSLAGDPVLARIDWRWLRYAPLTFWVIGGVGVAAGTVYRVLDGIGIEPWRVGFVQRAFTEFGNSMLWLTVPAATLAVVAVGSLGALVLYTENWWNLRAEWIDDRTLAVRRGLLTTRAVTIERARLRGVVLREPLLLRAAGGATVHAVAGGLGDVEETQRRGALLPPAPRARAVRVAAGALQLPRPPFEGADFTPHPRVALRRRTMRGLLLFVLPVTAALGILGALLTPVLLHSAWVFALVAVPVVGLLARDAYGALGHALSGRHLLVRSGTFSRDTLALERDAIAAWTFTSSPFARRAGLVTVTAAVAAGEHGYRIPDLAEETAASFAATAAPGIIEEFLHDA
ncbi:PH domain-containing protein [Streptomyces sp. NPDC000410]|uniref:PH domain-containing protein n=1 Tax=Streptomyces sp. NPDC000410 TaxID=3154254 RepID=UPI0033330890